MALQIPGGCLTDPNDSAASHTGVVLGPCHGGPAQAFAALPGGTVRIRGKCLEVNRTVSSRKSAVDGDGGAPAGAGSWLRNRAIGRCLADPAQPGAAFAARPAAVTGPCSAATPGAAWQLR